MRSVWSGNLAFGLVSIPVKLGSAVSSHKVSFRQIHLSDRGRVRYRKTCELDEEVLSASEIGRAYETPDDQLVEITDDDLDALPLPTAKTIEVSGFLDLTSVDSVQLDTPYFLAPSSPAANKPYVLMREALSRSGKAAVGKFAMRNSEHLALIMPREEILLLQTLRWPDELNSAADAAPKGRVNISDNELQLADTLIDALGEADLDVYHDEYAQAVEALVTAKLEGAELPAPGPEAAGGRVVDLMAALRASVEAAKGQRGGEGQGEREEEEAATVTQLQRSAQAPAAASAAAAAAAAAKKRGAGAGTRKTAAQEKKPASKSTGTKKTPAKKAAAKKAPSKRRAG
jgi:DNA end-binding protein Ku